MDSIAQREKVPNLLIIKKGEKMISAIYNNPEEKGIDLEFDFENGMAIKLFMDDKAAQDMINIIQNKLDGHFKK